MDAFDKHIKEQIQQMPLLSFDKAKQEKVIQRIKQIEHKRKQRVRFRTGWAVSAAVILIVASFNFPWEKNQLASAIESLKSRFQQTNTESLPMAWQNAPFLVRNVRIDTEQGRLTVRANITNMGNEPLDHGNVQGLLFLVGAEYFVDAPHQAVAPTQTVDWEFQPDPESLAPQMVSDKNVQLLFVYRQNSNDVRQAPHVQWSPISLRTEGNIQVIGRYGGQQQYVDVKSMIRNGGTKVIDLRKALAMIFFKQNEDSLDMDPATFKYFDDISIVNQDENTLLLPGQSSAVTFHLISPPGVDLTSSPVDMVFIDKTQLP